MLTHIATDTDSIVKVFIEKVINRANLSITDIAYYYEPELDWYYIYHNFSDRIFDDDDFAELIGELTYNKLILKGIKNFSIYENIEELSKLTKSYFEDSSEAFAYEEMGKINQTLSGEFNSIEDYDMESLSSSEDEKSN
ncbi:hypothetical protein SAMN05421781_0516 [Marinococcus luteus]|uniref:Uncharacterized protein n=1 Tax=Marinococcus luteus TaxID=1122204 RepID=A0A1H2QYZ7_9BACI|nr:hypothetical protein [Marinococcus luteus]SDW12138.1 hypothetical protein SAMN05421781_0516 [Marinococcus luteus]